MQRTTKIMFAYYMARNLALDVMWMRRRRNLILFGDFSHAMIKPCRIYSGDPVAIVDRRLDYASPLFDRARKYRCEPR